MTSSNTPIIVDTDPAKAGRPVVVSDTCKEVPETGYAALKSNGAVAIAENQSQP
jgi:hypothetical protein